MYIPIHFCFFLFYPKAVHQVPSLFNSIPSFHSFLIVFIAGKGGKRCDHRFSNVFRSNLVYIVLDGYNVTEPPAAGLPPFLGADSANLLYQPCSLKEKVLGGKYGFVERMAGVPGV